MARDEDSGVPPSRDMTARAPLSPASPGGFGPHGLVQGQGASSRPALPRSAPVQDACATCRSPLSGGLGLAQEVIHGLPGLFLLVDPAGSLHHWNRNLQEVTGLGWGEIPGIRLLDLVPVEDREGLARCLEEAWETGSSGAETALVTRSGGRMPHFLTASRVTHRGQDFLAATAMDISHWHQREEALLRLAATDVLTGSANRRELETELGYQAQIAERYGQACSLIMFDLDDFKRVNDIHGHEVGDLVLRELVAVTNERLRGVDTLARWGGEEFMVLAPATGLEGARELAERIRGALEAHPFSGLGWSLTASFGVAQYQPGEEVSGLFRRVDRALYRAKEGGRNRVREACPGKASGCPFRIVTTGE